MRLRLGTGCSLQIDLYKLLFLDFPIPSNHGISKEKMTLPLVLYRVDVFVFKKLANYLFVGTLTFNAKDKQLCVLMFLCEFLFKGKI
jgi:hypothetical protein